MKHLHYFGFLKNAVCLFVFAMSPGAVHAEPLTKTNSAGAVKVVADVAYYQGKDADAEKHRLDLYLPSGKTTFPVLMYVHGGGYQRGDRKEAEVFGKVFARQGVAVVAISYRLYPPAKHPAQIQDLARAFAWVKRNIDQYGGDPQRVFVSGHSAGAHLVSLLATDESYLQAEKLAFKDIQGVLAISGGYRIQPIRIEVFGDEAGMKAASPFSHISGGHPPFLLIYGSEEKQERHDLSNEFRDALLKAKGKAECVEIPDRDHAGLFSQISDGDPTVKAMLKFIAKHNHD
jgi:acetyl esterase/lipase